MEEYEIIAILEREVLDLLLRVRELEKKTAQQADALKHFERMM